MSKARRLWIVWKCQKCGRTDKDDVHGFLQVGIGRGSYSLDWECDKCRKINRISIQLECRIEWD
jgi:hypothetical protein